MALARTSDRVRKYVFLWKLDAYSCIFPCGLIHSVPVHSRLEILASGDLVLLSGDGNGEDLPIRLREAVIFCTDEGISLTFTREVRSQPP